MRQKESNHKIIIPDDDRIVLQEVQPNQDKKETPVRRNEMYLLFPTYENTIEHIDDLKRDYPEFMRKASAGLKKIDSMDLTEIEKSLNLTEEEASIWRDLIRTLVHYHDCNNFEDTTKKK